MELIDYLIDETLQNGTPVEGGLFFDGLWGEIMEDLYGRYGIFDDE